MVTGIVLANVERQLLKNVIDSILAIEGVTEVYTVAGEYDLAVMVRVKDNAQLAEIVANTMPHHIEGITRTKTMVCLDVRSKVDLAKIFSV